MNSFNASAAAYNRREQDIQGVNEMGIENYNAKVANQKSNYTSLKGQVAQANQAVGTQEGIEEGFAGVGAEPLLKSGIDYGAKSLYAAGKAAKAQRLGTRAEALAEGGEDAGENAGRGFTEMAADSMDSELAQNAAAVLKAPGQALSKVGDVVGDAGKAVGKAVYRGGQKAIQAVRGRINQQRAPDSESPGEGGAEEEEGGTEFAEATTDDFDELPSGLGDANQISNVRSVYSTQGGKFTGVGDTAPNQELSGSSSEQQAQLNANRASQAGEKLPQGEQGIGEGSELDQLAPMREAAGLRSAGRAAESQSETLVSATGEEVGSAAAGGAEGSAVGAGASSAGAAGAATAAETAGATAGEVAADAAAAGLDAAAAASEAVPGVGTVVGGLLAIGGGIAALFAGHKHHSSTPPAPKPPPKPTQMGINISESSPVMDSSIYRATGYNSMS